MFQPLIIQGGSSGVTIQFVWDDLRFITETFIKISVKRHVNVRSNWAKKERTICIFKNMPWLGNRHTISFYLSDFRISRCDTSTEGLDHVVTEINEDTECKLRVIVEHGVVSYSAVIQLSWKLQHCHCSIQYNIPCEQTPTGADHYFL